MEYNFKRWPELLFAVVTAVALVILSEIAGRSDFEDWQTWLPILGGSCARAAAGAAIGVLTRWKTSAK